MKEKRARELFAEEVQEEKANKGWKYIRNLFEASIDSLVTIGPDGIIIDVNLATEKATGLPREKIIGTDFSEYFTDPDKARVGYKQVFDIGKVIDYELCLKHVNGSSIPVLYNASVYKDNEGQIIGVLAAARDISALKKYADELTDFRNNLELIVQQKTAELVTANEELAFQNEEKEKRAEELVIANEKLLYQNEEKEKRAAELVIANEELLFQNEEKEKRAAELILANEELILQNEEKEKRAAELVLANRELAFQTGEKADRAAELIIANAELIHQNKEKDKRAAELIIANKELLFQNEEKEKRAAELIIANEELLFQNKEKEKRAAELIIANKELLFQNREKEKRAAELVIANEELAFQNEEKEKRAAELVIANKELESFSYSVSHDLRTPLRHVVGFVVLLNEHMQETLDDQNRHYLEVISKAANDMGQLIDDLLSFSRIGKTVMESRKVDLNLLIKQVIETFEPGMDRRSIEWDIGTLPNVNGDTEMLKLVMSNLISNALKFTSLKTSARIEIGSKPDPENKSQVVFYIKDNGAGFDMQYKEKLFGVFQRLHSQKDFQGTGIGLANVKRVIQRHGGRVWAEGVLEEGAIFYFTLPKYEEES